MKQWVMTAACLLALAGARTAGADILVLRGGDVLSGSLVELSGGVLVFKTSLSGKVLVPIAEVKTLATASDTRVTYKDGRVARGTLAVKNGATHLQTAALSTGGPVDWTAVGEIVPAASETPVEQTTPAWSGTWETGVQTRAGTAEYGALYGKLTLLREAERYTFALAFYLESAEQDRFPRRFRATADWQTGTVEVPYSRVLLDVERDTANALNLRADTSANVGRALLDSGEHRLEVETGLNLTAESWNRRPLWDETGHGLRASVRERWRPVIAGDENWRSDNQDLSLRFGLRYQRNMFGKGQLSENVTLLPGLTNFGELRAQSETSFMYPMSTGVKLRLNLRLDYDSAPEFSSLDSWQGSLGAGVEWDF